VNILPYLIAFSTTVLCILLLKSLAVRIGLVDAPSERKQHEGRVPVIGGLAIFLGFLSGLLTLPISLQPYRSFIAASVLLVFTGLLDDFQELSPRARFLAQLLAALLMVFWGGVALHHFGALIPHHRFILGHWSLFVTVIAVLGTINAVNMMDGIDGLAGTLVLMQLLCLVILAWHTQQTSAAVILSVLMASLSAFLCFNLRSPFVRCAQVFMGDAGSMLLGFALVWFLIDLSQTTTITPVTMLWIMALPLFDTTRIIIHRFWQGRSVCAPDRRHLHYLFLDLGFSVQQIIGLMVMIDLCFSAVGLMGYYLKISEYILFVGFFFSFIMYSWFVHRLCYRVYSMT